MKTVEIPFAVFDNWYGGQLPIPGEKVQLVIPGAPPNNGTVTDVDHGRQVVVIEPKVPDSTVY